MKKILILLVCIIFVALCGCGGKNEAVENNSSKPESQAVESKTDENSQKPATDNTESKAIDILSLQGEYQDEVSQRAMLSFDVSGNDSAIITVKWGNSATSTTVWTMTAVLSKDGTLGYSNEKKVDLITAEDSTTTENVFYTDKEGSFEIKDGALLWTGAYSEECRSCVFKKQ